MKMNNKEVFVLTNIEIVNKTIKTRRVKKVENVILL